MDTPLITWISLVSALVVIFIIRFVYIARMSGSRRHRLFEIGSEREEIFIPGDKQSDDEDNDYDGYDDI